MRYLVLAVGLMAIFRFDGASASHIFGADLSWTEIGEDTFKVSVNLYRECNGSNMDFGDILLSSSCRQKLFATKGIKIGDVTPVCSSTQTRCANSSSTFQYGVELYEAYAIIRLPGDKAKGCCDFTFSYQRCCRSNYITTGAWKEDIYLEASLNACDFPGASTFKWNTSGAGIGCIDQLMVMDHSLLLNSASGIDTVIYSRAKTMTNKTQETTWTGYSFDKPVRFSGYPNDTLPAPRGYHLSSSGTLVFTPTQAQVTIIGIKAEMIKNGKVVASTKRDVQLNVIKCPNNTPPSIRSNLPYNVCYGNHTSFEISASDRNGYEIKPVSNILGVSFDTTLGKYPSLEFNWTPSMSDTGLHHFEVIARDFNCPLPASSHKEFTVRVDHPHDFKPQLRKNEQNQCGAYSFALVDSASRKMKRIYWKVDDTRYIGSGDSVNYTFTDTGWHYVSAILDICPVMQFRDSVYVENSNLLSLTNFVDTASCDSQWMTLKPKVTGARGPLSYQWTSDSLLQIDTTSLPRQEAMVFGVGGDFELTLKVTDSLGCVLKHSINTIFRPESTMDLQKDIDLCLEQTNGKELALINGKGKWSGLPVSDGASLSHLGLPAGRYPIHYRFVNPSSFCYTDSAIVTIHKKPTVFAGPIRSCIGSLPLKLSGWPQGGIWQGNGVISNQFYAEKAGKGSTKLWYTYTDSLGCYNSDSTTAEVFEYDPKMILNGPTSVCISEDSFSVKGHPIHGAFWQGTNFGRNANKISLKPKELGLGNHLFTYRASDSNRCLRTDSLWVEVKPATNAQFNILDDSIQLNDHLGIENKSYGTNPTKYTWEVGPPISKKTEGFEPQIKMDKPGLHSVSLHAHDTISGCIDTFTRPKAVTVFDFVTRWTALSTPPTLYPNPASESFLLENSSSERATLKMVSSDGKAVLEQVLKPGVSNINIQWLPKGFYHISLFNEQLSQRTVVIIK